LLSEISISDLVESKGFEASLITTFNASLPYYEDLILRRLRANGCRHNVVLMDSAQCAASWETEAARPRQAGYEYTLIPVRSKGAFHPKVSIFAGPKKLAMLVGSHNLTVAGLGFNREITNLIEVQGKKHEFGVVLTDAWNSIESWLEHARSYCPADLISSALRLQNHIRPFLNTSGQETAARFLAQSGDSASLFEQIRQQVTFPVRRILVTGAFFDQHLEFLWSLRKAWHSSEIVVGIDPETVVLPRMMSDLNMRFVDARAAWSEDGDKYLHAKALYIEGDGTSSVFLSGSANPSAPGWGIKPKQANTEAMILLQGAAAKTALEQTGLGLLFAFEPIDPGELAATVARAAHASNVQPSTALAILIGTADYSTNSISAKVPGNAEIVQVQAIDEWDEDLEISPTFTFADDSVTIGIPAHLAEIRSLVMYGNEGPIARILVHHSSVVNAHSASSRQQAIRAALGEIGSTGTDVAWLIEQVQQVIFAADVSDHVGLKAGHSTSEELHASDRPDTLGADATEFGQRKKKRRLIESGDLGYLLDTLIRQLHISTPSSPHHVPEPTSVEDEEEAEDLGDPSGDQPMDDAEIAEAVARKSRSLIRKMIEKERQAASNKTYVPTMLVQLVAVLAILKELRHLERQGRWRESGLQLVDSHALQSLLQESMFYLFSSSHRLWSLTEGEGGERFEELDTLNLLLTWLAWEVGYTFTLSIPKEWELGREDRDWLLAGNGYLAKLLPRISVESQWNTLQTAILRTIRPIPADKKGADVWLQTNTLCGDALLDEFTNTDGRTEKRISVGGFAYVPRMMDPWSVVLDYDEKKVALWDFEFKPEGVLARRSFLQSAVISASSIQN
jgi:phosphatidylserine/phosphatidylglycerophosphate/cardiolipin synthase-like enzyme